MTGDTLDVAIVISMVVLVVYPSGLMILEALQERRRRRVRLEARPRRR